MVVVLVVQLLALVDRMERILYFQQLHLRAAVAEVEAHKRLKLEVQEVAEVVVRARAGHRELSGKEQMEVMPL